MDEIIKQGRPTEFCEEYVVRAYRYAMLGATDEQMAHFFSVSRDTIDRWKNKYPAFGEALEHGKAVADQSVVENLYKLANGYELTEKTETVINGETRTETITKKYPPSLGAISFWLRNRQKSAWNEKYSAEQQKAAAEKQAREAEASKYNTIMGRVFVITSKEHHNAAKQAYKYGFLKEEDRLITAFHDEDEEDEEEGEEQDGTENEEGIWS